MITCDKNKSLLNGVRERTEGDLTNVDSNSRRTFSASASPTDNKFVYQSARWLPIFQFACKLTLLTSIAGLVNRKCNDIVFLTWLECCSAISTLSTDLVQFNPLTHSQFFLMLAHDLLDRIQKQNLYVIEGYEFFFGCEVIANNWVLLEFLQGLHLDRLHWDHLVLCNVVSDCCKFFGCVTGVVGQLMG